MKIEATREPIAPITLTFTVSTPEELAVFNALAQQSYSGPAALNEYARKYVGAKYTQVNPVVAERLFTALRSELKSVDAYTGAF
jgi:hypothetical protein